MKECPYCWKRIPDRAIKCKYCYHFLDEKDEDKRQIKNEDHPGENHTKDKKVLTTEESAELRELEEFYNKNSDSLLGNVAAYSWCLIYLSLILFCIFSVFIMDISEYEYLIVILIGIFTLVFIVCNSILLYKKTNNYIKYTWIDVWWAVSYWIPLVHYTTSPILIEKIGEKFSNDERFNLENNTLKVNKWINILYTICILLVGFMVLGFFYHSEKAYFDLSNHSDWLNYLNTLIVLAVIYSYYIGYYEKKLNKIEESISRRISKLKWEDNKDEEQD